MESVKPIKRKSFCFRGFGFRYLLAESDDKSIFKGGSFYVFDKQILTIIFSSKNWTDENGVPYKVKFDKGVLYIKKLAIGISS